MCRALAILSGGRDVRTNLTEPIRIRDHWEGARDFLFEFHHPATRIAFSLVVVKEHLEIIHEGQHFAGVGFQPIQQVLG